jgi:hypothetical protein
MNGFSAALFFVLFLVGVHSTHGQSLSGEITAGYGTFAMGDVKSLLKEQHRSISGLPAQITHNYPAYGVWTARVLLVRGEGSVGINVKSMSSGARISYRDYSGKITLDHLASAKALGGSVARALWRSKQWEFRLRGDADVLVSRVQLKNQITVYDQQEEEVVDLRSIGIALEPGTVLSYKKGRFSAGLDLGYFLNANGPLHLKGEPEFYLVDGSNNKIAANWSGFRGSLGIAYQFPSSR